MVEPSKTVDQKHQHEEASKISVPAINMVVIKKGAISPSNGSPKLTRALTKPSSGRWNCLCSPTTHAGSFRCRFHRGPAGMVRGHSVGSSLSELAAKSHRAFSNLAS